MTDKAFESAGKMPGLQIWRVENLELVEVPKEHYGTFFTGDTYVLLETISTCPPVHNVFTWIGSEASQDEMGAAAILMLKLDEHLGRDPCQYSEFQCEESCDFMKNFKNGIIYKKGGVASGFKHVVINDDSEQRLLQVKGRRTVRATEVDMSWDSVNSADCFIVVLGLGIFIWSGKKSNYFERLKATKVAKGIRDNEHNGRGEVHNICEGEESDEVINVLGPKPDLPSESPETDSQVSVKAKCEASLYMISNDSGTMKEELVAAKSPFKQNMLQKTECYILDDPRNKRIFVWKGSDANCEERKKAMKSADDFIKKHNYPCRTKKVTLPAGAECTLFKQYFDDWMDKSEITGPGEAYTMGRIAKVEKIPFDASSLHDNKAMAAQHGMVDDGSGKVEIYRVEMGEDKELVPVDCKLHGQFFGGDCYLVVYTYKHGRREKHIIYTWQGDKCSRDELAASAYLTVNKDDEMGGAATQVRVTQGKEPPHLMSLFGGKPLVIHGGGTSRSGGQSAPGSTRLFHIRRSTAKATRAVEVEPTASSLNTNDVFVLIVEKDVTVWKGKGGTDEEMTAAEYVARLLGQSEFSTVEEEAEPDSFWEALGGKADYQTSPTLQSNLKEPRLFACSNKTGRLIVEEVPGEFTQSDLACDDIMILDTWDEIFVWIGNEANDEEKGGALKIAQEYLEADPSGRRGIPITTIKQGAEPDTFTGWFHAWDDDKWETEQQEMAELIKKFGGRN